MDFRNYFQELKRRNVFKAALAYVVVGWIILQVIAIVFPMFNIPKTISKAVFLILLIGFPVWLIFAWIYELSPEGLKKTEKVDSQRAPRSATENKFNKIIVGSLIVAILLLGANLFTNSTQKAATKPKTEANPEIESTAGFLGKKKIMEKSVAVLAFENMSSDKEQEYFSDGISEEILNSLAKIPELKVISRTSSFAYKDTYKDIKTIAKELGVEYILEGSVRKAGDQVRITAQLINTRDGTHLWSETFDRKLKDIFQIQEEIAGEVTENLKTSVLDISVKRTSPEAYTLYLRASHLFNQSQKTALNDALRLLKEAVQIDPDYAPAWSLLSRVYSRLGFSTLEMSKDKAYDLGLRAAERAIQADSGYANGYMDLANFNRIKFQFGKVKKFVDKAIDLEPENPEVLGYRAIYRFQSVEKMIQDNKKSIKLDPLNYKNYYRLGFLYYWIGRNDKALEALNIYEKHVPSGTALHATRAEIFLAQGKGKDALKEVDKETSNYFRNYVKIKVLHWLGEQEKAMIQLVKFQEEYPGEAANIADIYASMGNREKVFVWLKKAVEIKDSSLSEVLYYPSFKKFYDDPRWQQLIKDMGVPSNHEIPGIK